MGDWRPDESVVKELCLLLREVPNPSSEVQSRLRQQMGAAERALGPSFVLHLLWLLVHGQHAHASTDERMAAGVILKSVLVRHVEQVDRAHRPLLRSALLEGLADPERPLRRTTALLIAALVHATSLRAWPELVPRLVAALGGNSPAAKEGAFTVLDMLSDEAALEMDSDEAGKPLALLLPVLLAHFQHPDLQWRLAALGVMQKMLAVMPAGLAPHVGRFLEGYLWLCADPNLRVKHRVLVALLTLVDTRISAVVPVLPQVVEYAMWCQRAPELVPDEEEEAESLALVALDLYRLLCRYPEHAEQVLRPVLGPVFQVLLERLPYSDQDLADLGLQSDHVAAPDRPQDVRPQHASSTRKGGQQGEDEGEDAAYDNLQHWNLRKAAGEALERLAQTLSEPFLGLLLPQVEKALQHSDWRMREAALLVLGCVSMGKMAPHLPGLVPFLLALVRDDHPLLRSVACWTLARYSRWLLRYQEGEGASAMVAALLTAMTDSSKKVQKAATSALAIFIQEAGPQVRPYVPAFLQVVHTCFPVYQRRNLFVLYDAIGTLAEALGERLAESGWLGQLMPLLQAKWASIADEDEDLFPLLDCLNCLAHNLRHHFIPHVGPLFARALRLIRNTLMAQAALEANPRLTPPNREFLVCALDLLSGLAEALGGALDGFVQEAQLVPLLLEVCRDPRPDYGQSAFALWGDLVRHAWPQVRPQVPQLLPLLVGALRPRFPEACNNACWALGELIMRLGPDAAPFLPLLLERLLSLLADRKADRILETVAVCLCRLALVAPQPVAQGVAPHVRLLLGALRNLLYDDAEKEDALKGLCALVSAQPQLVLPELHLFLEALLSFHEPPRALRDMIRDLLRNFKQALGEQQWGRATHALPQSLTKSLNRDYQI